MSMKELIDAIDLFILSEKEESPDALNIYNAEYLDIDCEERPTHCSSNSHNPETLLIFKETIQNLGQEASLLLRVIVHLPEDAFTATSVVIKKYLSDHMKKYHKWDKRKTMIQMGKIQQAFSR